MNCPICNKDLQQSDQFCPVCGYDIHIFPSEVSPELHEYEEKRINAYKKTFQAIEQNAQRVSELSSQAEEKQKALDSLNEQNKELENEITRLQKMAEEVVMKPLKIKSAGDDVKLLQFLLHIKPDGKYGESTQKAVMEFQKHHGLACDGVVGTDTWKALGVNGNDRISLSTIIKIISEQPLAVLVMTQGEKISSMFGIYEGDNSFGYTPSHDTHQQIICKAKVANIHFIITVTSSSDSLGRKKYHFFIEPKDGEIYKSANNANIIRSQEPLELNGSFFIDNVRFTLVDKKF